MGRLAHRLHRIFGARRGDQVEPGGDRLSTAFVVADPGDAQVGAGRIGIGRAGERAELVFVDIDLQRRLSFALDLLGAQVEVVPRVIAAVLPSGRAAGGGSLP